MIFRKSIVPLFLVGLLLLGAAPAAAFEWAAGPVLQVMSFDSGALDDLIAPYGMPGYGGYAQAPGLTGVMRWNRWLAMPSAFAFLRSNKKHSDSAWLYYGWGLLDVGYDLASAPHWTIAPFAGVGMGYTKVTLDTVDPAPLEAIARQSAVVEGGVALAYRLYGEGSRFLTIPMLRMGYQQQIPLQDWQEADKRAGEQPDFTLSGVFVRMEWVFGCTCP